MGDVCYFGTRGEGMNRHALKHVRCHDDGLASLAAAYNDLILDHGEALERELRAEIPACDHHSTRFTNDLHNILNSLHRLDLGNNLHGAPSLLEEGVDSPYLFGTADERETKEVHPLIGGEGNVIPIPLGDGGKINISTRQINVAARTDES
jgi:hypothetical protein